MVGSRRAPPSLAKGYRLPFCIEIAREPVVRFRHDDEERRRIDAHVIGPVGDLSTACHLAEAKLVKNLPRLFLGDRVRLLSLKSSERTERFGGELRVERQRLV